MGDWGSGAFAELTSYVPTDCDPSEGPATGNCTSIFVSTVEDTCLASVGSTCTAATTFYSQQDEVSSFPWGMVVSIIADCIISAGLALQKVAHNRIEAMKKAALTESGQKIEGAEEPVPTKMGVWWGGLLCTIFGEVGNFAAYGDPATPASVVTAVGCVGVIANAGIATLFLGEEFRRRDAVGIIFVILGVVLVVGFAPQQQKELTADLLEEYLSSPWTIIYLVVLFGSIGALYFLCPIHGHRHVLWNLSMASLIGSVTVMASKCVSTFIVQTFASLATGPIFDQVDLSYGSNSSSAQAAECWEDGHVWGEIEWAPASVYGCITHSPSYDCVNSSTGIIVDGKSQHANPFLYISLILMIVTAVAQVKYINMGMSMFGNSEVIPCHYVTFTLFSIVGTSITYQEFAITYEGVCRVDIFLHFFLDGCIFTFAGVWLITSNRKAEPPPHAIEGDDGTEMLALKQASGIDLQIGDHRNTHGAPPDGDGVEEGSVLTPLPSEASNSEHATLRVANLKKMNASQQSDQITALPDMPPSPLQSPRARRPSMAESFDARTSRRDSRSASVSTFLSVLGGGHSAAFLFDPADKEDKALAAQLEEKKLQQAQRRYSRNNNGSDMAKSFSSNMGGGGSGTPRIIGGGGTPSQLAMSLPNVQAASDHQLASAPAPPAI